MNEWNPKKAGMLSTAQRKRGNGEDERKKGEQRKTIQWLSSSCQRRAEMAGRWGGLGLDSRAKGTL